MSWNIRSWNNSSISRADAVQVISAIDQMIDFSKFSSKCGIFEFVGRDLLPGDFQEAFYDRNTHLITVAVSLPRGGGEIGNMIASTQNSGLLAHYAATDLDMVKTVLLHEAAHQIHRYIDTTGIMLSAEMPTFRPIWDAWKLAAADGAYITDWAASPNGAPIGSLKQLNEYFAETFAARFLYPNILAAQDSNGYALIDAVVAAF